MYCFPKVVDELRYACKYAAEPSKLKLQSKQRKKNVMYDLI